MNEKLFLLVHAVSLDYSLIRHKGQGTSDKEQGT